MYAETIYGTFFGSKEQSVPSILQSNFLPWCNLLVGQMPLPEDSDCTHQHKFIASLAVYQDDFQPNCYMFGSTS